MGFIPLHVKSDYSLGYGTAAVDDPVAAAVARSYPALALTDLENLYGQLRLHHRCALRGIRPLTGLELRPDFDGRSSPGSRQGRLLLLASDRAGWGSLCRIVSHRRGGAVGARREAAARFGVRLVADTDCVFLDPSGHSLHLLQLAIRLGTTVERIASHPLAEPPQRYLRPPAETARLFADLPDALDAARDVALAWVYERFGRDRVAMVAAHHTFQARSALREGLKAFGVRPSLIDLLCRRLPPHDLQVAEVDFLGLAAGLGEPDPLSQANLGLQAGALAGGMEGSGEQMPVAARGPGQGRLPRRRGRVPCRLAGSSC